MKYLTNKHIVVGITGGIAAYKTAELVRLLRQAGAKVRVVMTTAAKQFITPLTMQALSGQPVLDDLFDRQAEAAMGHIELARWAHAIIIAPASADCLAQLASGQARDLLTTLCLATRAPILIAPAMNQAMWQHPATQTNCQQLQKINYKIVGPAYGEQACGDVGPGRMIEPEQILEQIMSLFSNTQLSGLRVLITAGPTREPIDPVRYLTNHSSGKMGYAVAVAALEAGAEVHIVSGPVTLEAPSDAKITYVETAQQMFDTVMTNIQNTDIFIAAAAVADFRCQHIETKKMKKSALGTTLQIIENPDIVSEVGKKQLCPFIVGFAAETDDVEHNAQKKRREKGMDMIAANQVGMKEMGFNSDTNQLTLYWDGGEQLFPLSDKYQQAKQFINLISEQYDAKYPSKNS